MDAKGYLALAQFGVIEFHAWGCHCETLEKPDRVIFDLDPGEGIKLAADRRGGLLCPRRTSNESGSTPFVKTSGGKGLHVVVPLKPKLDWKKTPRRDRRNRRRASPRAAPETFVVNMAKDKRAKRIFIDFHRNGRGWRRPWRPTACARGRTFRPRLPLTGVIYDPSTLRKI